MRVFGVDQKVKQTRPHVSEIWLIFGPWERPRAPRSMGGGSPKNIYPGPQGLWGPATAKNPRLWTGKRKTVDP